MFDIAALFDIAATRDVAATREGMGSSGKVEVLVGHPARTSLLPGLGGAR